MGKGDWTLVLIIGLLFIPSAHVTKITQLTASPANLNLPSVLVEFTSSPNATSCNIYYRKLDGPTGADSTETKVSGVGNSSYLLEKLEFGATYNISVTSIVAGKEGSKVTQTINTVDAPAPNVSSYSTVEVLMVSYPNARYYEIVAFQAPPTYNQLPDPSIITDAKPFDNRFGSIYYSALQETSINGDFGIVTIGDNTTSGPNDEFRNAPLEADSRYTFFQRTTKNDSQYIIYPFMPIVRTKAKVGTADKGLTSTEIVAIIVGVTAGVVGLVFIAICCFNWKYSLRYKPRPGKGNPIKRLLTDPAIPVTKEDFFDHVTQMKLHNFKGFYEEFSSQKNEFHASEAFRNPDNAHKNRFFNIPCYDYCRVNLEGKDDVETYIHANFVPGAYSDRDYIMTQAPLPETVDDFWAMVWQQDSKIVVMIGELIEKGNIVSASYFPEEEGAVIKFYCSVKLMKLHKTADYIVRSLKLTRKGTEKNVSHYQFVGWPTVQITPEYPLSFLEMVNVISQATPERPSKPIVVHGTTGYGRAGIYVCIDSQIQRYMKQGDLSVYDAVLTVKKHRHDGVKTLDEYIFIHDAVLEAVLLDKVDDIAVEDLPKYIEKASKGSKDLFAVEFECLTSTTMASTQKMGSASEPCNSMKNRYANIKPYDYNRVKLAKLKNEGGSDYINASFINTYGRKRAFIATQAPLVETIADFWRMIDETESWVIIMLGQEIENGQLKANRFWPEEGFAMILGELTVKFISITHNALNDVWLRQLELRNGKSERKLIQFYQYHSWPSHVTITSQSISSLVQLVHQSEQWRAKLNAKVITVVSSSGIGRPGVLIGLRSLHEQSDLEGHVNVFTTARKLNQQRPLLVQTREEYALMYTSTLDMTENARRKGVIKENKIEHMAEDHCCIGVHDTSEFEVPDTTIDAKPTVNDTKPKDSSIETKAPLAGKDVEIEMQPIDNDLIAEEPRSVRVSFSTAGKSGADSRVDVASEDA